MVQQLVRAVRTEAVQPDKGVGNQKGNKPLNKTGEKENRNNPFENLLKDRIGKMNPGGLLKPKTLRFEGAGKRAVPETVRKMTAGGDKTAADKLKSALKKTEEELKGEKLSPVKQEKTDTDRPEIRTAEIRKNERKAETASLQVPEQTGAPREQQRDLRLEKNEKKEKSEKTASLTDKKNSRELIITLDDRRTNKISGTSGEKGSGTGLQKDALKQQKGAFKSGESFEASVRESLAFRETEASAEGSGSLRQPPVTRAAGDLLDRYLKTSGNREIARNIHFTLKDSNSGEIRLVLKPESLGNVRIRLQLTENNITGRIFVENNTVKEIFQDNIREISRMLEEQGFNTSGLDVTVDSGNGNSENNGQDDTGKMNRPFFSGRLREMESNIPTAAAYRNQESGVLDMVI